MDKGIKEIIIKKEALKKYIYAKIVKTELNKYNKRNMVKNRSERSQELKLGGIWETSK